MSGYATGGSGGSQINVASAVVTTGDISPVPDTGGAWAVLAGVAELQIAAVEGDNIGVNAVGLRNGIAAVDVVTVTGVGPTIATYQATGFTTSPGFDGEPSWYFDNLFCIRGGEVCFVASSTHIENGLIRFRIAVKTSGATGTFYASSNYPFKWNAKNYGQ